MSTKQNITDPTYLRTIHDGLLSGTIHKDNASTLPIGLIGIYEEALPPASNVNERKKFLEFFAVWALLKKEVSAAFVVPLLEGWTEENVLDYISQYSKWFNSPVSGKYSLYHERLRTFVILKVSHGHFTACNEAIIQNCPTALQAKSGDEQEYYALEHLSLHLLIQAMESKNAAALKTLAYDTTHWNRQVEISKGFEWSKQLLNNMMLWASKYEEDEVIVCALNKVDLHHQEQNDAPRIVELVAQNDIETALQRIEAFGGNDKEGIQRKFILYMLCLMEVTLLDSKDKPFRKDSIEKLLKHLDDTLPIDHSVLTWNDFFSSYIVFLMASEWAALGLDYVILFKRTELTEWDNYWIKEKGPFTDLQFEILLECARGISNEYHKSSALKDISTEQAKQGKIEEAATVMDEAICWARSISNEEYIKSGMLKDISSELARQEKLEEAVSALNEAICCALSISNESDKGFALEGISTEIAKQGDFEVALSYTQGIRDESDKSRALKDISTEMAKQGKSKEALTCAQSIDDDYWKCCALMNISTEMGKQGKFEEAHAYARGISNKYWKSNALKDISTELAKLGKIEEAATMMQEALVCARDISWDNEKSYALKNISSELAKQGEIEEAAAAMQEALVCARGISHVSDKCKELREISTELANQGKFVAATAVLQEAISCTRGYNEEYSKSNALKEYSTVLAKLGKIQEAAITMLKALESARGIGSDRNKSSALKDISSELARQGKVEEAFECAQGISNEYSNDFKSIALKDISSELARQGKLEEAFECAQGISYADKSSMLKDIATELARQGKIEEALEFAGGIIDEWENSSAMMTISSELFKRRKTDEAAFVIQEAIACARNISHDGWKCRALKDISTELAKQVKLEEAASVMHEAICCALSISNELDKDFALEGISTELAKQGDFEVALSYTQGIRDESDKSRALKDISTEMAKQGKSEDAFKCAKGISNKYLKSNALKDISSQLAKQGKYEEAASAMQEALAYAQDNNALRSISTELANQGNWTKAEKTGFEILQIAERHDCWNEIAQNAYKKAGWKKALQQLNQFKNDEVKTHFLKGLANSITLIDSDKELILNARSYYNNDIEYMEKLLQNYALHELFFSEASSEKIERLNRTLNIQWAISIKNSFSVN